MAKDSSTLRATQNTSSLNYVSPTYLSLKNHTTLNERWLQDRIDEDPKLLDLPGYWIFPAI